MEKIEKKAVCEPDKCNAFCCRYLSIHIGEPSARLHFDEIKWYVGHTGTSVYKDSAGQWIVDVLTDCEFLENNRCTDYENRPRLCRAYGPVGCISSLTELDRIIVFNKPEDVNKYVDELFSKKKKKKVKGKAKGKKKKTKK